MREYKKNKISKAFWSQRVPVGKEWKIVLDTATDAHCIYLVSTSFDCNSFPREISEATRWGVSIPDQGAHLEVFRGEWTQIHNGSPWGLPCSAQFEPPIINITGRKWGGGWNCVHVHRRRRGGMCVRVWVMHYIVCVCVTTTPCSVPLDTIFHRAIGLSAAIFLAAFRHRLKTHALSPESVTEACLPLQCLNLLVSSNIWFWWSSWLHQHSCASFRVCVFVFFFDFAVAPLVRHRLRAHGKYALRQPVSWRRHRKEMKKRFLIISVQHDCWA